MYIVCISCNKSFGRRCWLCVFDNYILVVRQNKRKFTLKIDVNPPIYSRPFWFFFLFFRQYFFSSSITSFLSLLACILLYYFCVVFYFYSLYSTFPDFDEVYVGHTEYCVHLAMKREKKKKELMQIHAHIKPKTA